MTPILFVTSIETTLNTLAHTFVAVQDAFLFHIQDSTFVFEPQSHSTGVRFDIFVFHQLQPSRSSIGSEGVVVLSLDFV